MVNKRKTMGKMVVFHPCIVNYFSECTMFIVSSPKISSLIVPLKIFWASNSSTVNGWWVINGKPCEKWLFYTVLVLLPVLFNSLYSVGITSSPVKNLWLDVYPMVFHGSHYIITQAYCCLTECQVITRL